MTPGRVLIVSMAEVVAAASHKMGPDREKRKQRAAAVTILDVFILSGKSDIGCFLIYDSGKNGNHMLK